MGRKTLPMVPRIPNPHKGVQRIHGYCSMSSSTISFSQAPPITSMDPALRLRMRGDLLGRPGPSEGRGEVCSARSGSSGTFPGHRFSMLPWSVFISSFYPTTGTDRKSVNGLQPPNPIFQPFYLPVLFPSFPPPDS